MSPSPPSRRIVRVCLAGLLATIGLFARAFIPVEPAPALAFRLVFWLTAGLLLASWWWEPRASRRLRWIAGLPIAAVLALALGFAAALGILLLHILHPGWLGPVLGAELLLLTAAVGLRGRRWARLGYAAVTLAAIDALIYVALCWTLWSPTPPDVCAAVDAQPGVSRIGPAAHPDDLSRAYGLGWSPAAQTLVSSWKMAGNLTLNFWDEPTANRLVVWAIDGSDAPPRAELPLHGSLMPEYFAAHPALPHVAVTGLGYGTNRLWWVDVGAFPAIRLMGSAELEIEPHQLVARHDGGGVAVADVNGRVVNYGWGSSRPESTTAPLGPLIVMGVDIAPDAEVLYLAFAGFRLIELDLDTGHQREGSLPFGCAHMQRDPTRDRLLLTSVTAHAVVEMDTNTLEVTRTVKLPYATRAATLVGDGRWLAVAEWLSGRVHLFDAETLTDTGLEVTIGPDARSLLWVGEHQRLFATSNCGVSQIDLSVIAEPEPGGR